MRNQEPRDEYEAQDRADTAAAILEIPKLTRDQSKIERLRWVVDNKQCARIDGLVVDIFSASAVIGVYDQLSDANKAKLAVMPIRTMVSVALRVLEKRREAAYS